MEKAIKIIDQVIERDVEIYGSHNLNEGLNNGRLFGSLYAEWCIYGYVNPKQLFSDEYKNLLQERVEKYFNRRKDKIKEILKLVS